MHSWFERNTWQYPQWTVEDLVARKGSQRISVVLPALNEEATVGAIITALVPLAHNGLLDELVVMDSGSTDRTAEVAAAAGARVVHREDVLPELPPVPGKGEVLWRSLAATSGGLVLFLDSDLVDFDPGFAVALLGPLLTRPEVQLVKGFYRRPLRLESSGGGRVTELLARPVLSALRPELSGIIQPLGGEYAARRSFLESVPFAAGYGVEIGLLLDAHTRFGLSGLAQVNLGVRKHRNRCLQQLGVMARQILGAALSRCGVQEGDSAEFVQFAQVAGEWSPEVSVVPLADRPPMHQVLDIGSGTTLNGCGALHFPL